MDPSSVEHPHVAQGSLAQLVFDGDANHALEIRKRDAPRFSLAMTLETLRKKVRASSQDTTGRVS